MHPLPGGAGVGLSAQPNRYGKDDTCKMLNKILKVKVSDTTNDDSSNVDHYINNIILKN